MAEERVHPEARKTSDWRKALWTMVNGAAVPENLTDAEMQSSWEQLPDCSDKQVCGEIAAAKRRRPDDDESQLMDPDTARRLEDSASEQWEKFYSHFGQKFFKDRHYLRREYPELFAIIDSKFVYSLSLSMRYKLCLLL